MGVKVGHSVGVALLLKSRRAPFACTLKRPQTSVFIGWLGRDLRVSRVPRGPVRGQRVGGVGGVALLLLLLLLLLPPPLPLLTATPLRAREHDIRVLVPAALRVDGEGGDCPLLLVGIDGLHLLRPFRGDRRAVRAVNASSGSIEIGETVLGTNWFLYDLDKSGGANLWRWWWWWWEGGLGTSLCTR